MLPDTVYTLLGVLKNNPEGPWQARTYASFKQQLHCNGKQALVQSCCLPTTNASHDPQREFEKVLCVAAACDSSDDAQAQMPASNEAASVSVHHQQKDSMQLGMLPKKKGCAAV